MIMPLAVPVILSALLPSGNTLSVPRHAVSLYESMPVPIAETQRVHEVDRFTLTKELVRVGLEPIALAASGARPEDVQQIVASFREALARDGELIAAADTAWRRAAEERLMLHNLFQTGQATMDNVPRLQNATARMQEAAAARDQLLASLLNEGSRSLNDQTKARLAAVARQRSCGIPVEFLVVERPAQELIQLREALDERSITPPDRRRDRQVLSQAEMDTRVIAARDGLGSAETLDAAWRRAIAE